MINRNGLTSFIGNTPLIRLTFPDGSGGAQIWCKLEFMNPGGSCKDRTCLGILESMESTKMLKPGDALIEASGGNTAVSLAMIAAARKYPLTIVMPDTVPPERKRLLSAYGANLVLTPPANGMKGSIAKALEIAESKKRIFMINQFENPANPEIHRRTTAAEILRDLGRVPDVLVAGVGTGGTITGVGEVFKEKNPHTRVVAVEPSDSAILSGGNPGPHRIPGIGAGFVPRVLNTDIIDDVAVVTYQEAVKAVKTLAEKEGIFVGLSSGAALHAAMRQAQRLDPKKVVVTILCDAGERYVCSWP
ncbi:MAG: cysteine synthase A [Desulfomonile tiedjei]|uniref:cysteine synthase n=1 Tax=Desulfomonile tiedjei TaxID=2358 RepID=A0A9D6V8C3_9BACT|nr:cysteine synthase A [Desulfomonile tiedjei]